MINLYRHYISIDRDDLGNLFCSGDALNYTLNFLSIKDKNSFFEIKKIYRHFRKELKLSFMSLEVVNFENINTENEFENFIFDPLSNGSLFFEFDIPMIWIDNESHEITEIVLPRGCELRFYKNDLLKHPLSVVISFNFNLFSNNLVKHNTIGTYSPCLYPFKDGARINRSLVRNSIITLANEYSDIEIYFSSEIGMLTGFDKYGVSSKTDFYFD